jgi:hypothetical protein
MREIPLAAAGLMLGLAAARSIPHASILPILVLAPLLFISDVKRRRLPELLTIPWVTYEAAGATAALPYTAPAMIATGLTMAAGLAVVLAGAREKKALLGVGDVLVIGAVELAFADNRSFGPMTFPAIAACAVLLSLVLASIGRRRLAGAPFGGTLAAVAMSVCLPVVLG